MPICTFYRKENLQNDRYKHIRCWHYQNLATLPFSITATGEKMQFSWYIFIFDACLALFFSMLWLRKYLMHKLPNKTKFIFQTSHMECDITVNVFVITPIWESVKLIILGRWSLDRKQHFHLLEIIKNSCINI